MERKVKMKKINPAIKYTIRVTKVVDSQVYFTHCENQFETLQEAEEYLKSYPPDPQFEYEIEEF